LVWVDVSLVRTPLGYYRVDPIPAREELRSHYSREYFDGSRDRSQYALRYSDAELRHKAIPVDELAVFAPMPGRVFEVGFGEGFVLAELGRRGWQIAGVDFTDAGARVHNPSILDRVSVGDVFDVLDDMVREGREFDALVCNNVLEHVPDPEGLARSLLGVVAPGAVARFVVPNDGSALQDAVVALDAAPARYWVRFPDHLNYFTATTAPVLLRAAGWEIVDVLGEFPIDLFLLNPDTNYERDPSRGKNCHNARVAFENVVASGGIDRLVEFRRGCARAGVGRDIVVYARRAAP